MAASSWVTTAGHILADAGTLAVVPLFTKRTIQGRTLRLAFACCCVPLVPRIALLPGTIRLTLTTVDAHVLSLSFWTTFLLAVTLAVLPAEVLACRTFLLTAALASTGGIVCPHLERISAASLFRTLALASRSVVVG
mgnify:CR=1 FL=1